MSCWNDIYDEQLCCTCGYPGCWQPPHFTYAACCGSLPSSSSKVHTWDAVQNQSHSTTSEILCTSKGIQRCSQPHAGQLDPMCNAFARYAAGVTTKCWERLLAIQLCGSGLLLALTNAMLFPQPKIALAKQPQTTSQGCSALAFKFNMVHRLWQTHLKDQERLTPSREFYMRFHLKYLRRCGRLRKRELRRHLPRARIAFSKEAMLEPRPHVRGRASIGIVVAVSQSQWKYYGQILDSWHCYCAKHKDCEVVLEWSDFLTLHEYPTLKFWESGAMKMVVGKTWNRWFALRRHLDSFQWVLTLDPDQFLSRACFGAVSLTDALKAAGAPDAAWPPVIVMRDFPRYHTLNSAAVFLRGGDAGRLFLTLLFEKAYWYGIADFDQSAFDQSVLEFLDLWLASRPNPAAFSLSGSEHCMEFFLTWLDGEIVLDMYKDCWHNFVDLVVGGDFAQRPVSSPVPIRLLDPQRIDINYVFGARSTDNEPLIWHMAGKNKLLVDESTNLTMMDYFLREVWNTTEFPPASRPSWKAPEEAPHLPSGPNCSAWEEAASGAGPCDPGTTVYDCRRNYLAMC